MDGSTTLTTGNYRTRIGVLEIVCCLLALSGCGWPINPDRMPDVLRELAQDDASGCFWIGGRGGGGGGSIVPPVPVTGVYGSGEVLFGRVAADNTRLTIKNGECAIERGAR